MVNALHGTRARTERVIALGRVVLAGFSLLAIWLDPPAPSKHADITYTLVTVYLGYALILAAWVWHAVTTVERVVMGVHAIDILAFTLLMYFTDGVTSPFFVYFVFAVIAGALRWLWKGALWTGLAVLAIFLSMGLYFHFGLADAEIEGHRFIIRGVYLGVVALLLAYMTAYEQRLREELASLAARKAVEFQASLLDAVEQAVVATDGEGRVLYWNRFAEQLYGWRSTEVTGRSLRDVITFIQGDGQRLDVRRQCLKGAGWTGEVEAVRRDGSRFPAYLVCSRLRGDAQGYVSLSLDITALCKFVHC